MSSMLDAHYAAAYPLVRGGGLFLMIAGAAILLGALSFQARNRLLAAGVAVAAVATALSAGTLAAPFGAPTRAQVVWLAAAVALEAALIPLVVRRAWPHGERAVLLAVLLVVGVHFLPMAVADCGLTQDVLSVAGSALSPGKIP